MATNIILVQTKDTTTEQINESVVRLLKYRINLVSAGHNEVKFYCYTDTPEGLLPQINHLPLIRRDEITDENYYKLDLLKGYTYLFGVECKNVIWNPKLVPLDLCQTTILQSMSPAGDIGHLPEGFEADAEMLATIRDNKLPFMEVPTTWYTLEDEVQTDYKANWYLGYNAEDLREISLTFDEDPAGHIATHSATGGFDSFIAEHFKGVVVPTQIGEFGGYYINNAEKNLELNAQWIENVQTYFPAEWYPPHDEDMMANYISIDHEWRTISKQTRFVYLEGDDDPYTDMYARLWLL
jgi:hypothetical protein